MHSLKENLESLDPDIHRRLSKHGFYDMTGEATASMLTEPCGTATASDTTAGSATAKTSAKVPTGVGVHGDSSSAHPCWALRVKFPEHLS